MGQGKKLFAAFADFHRPLFARPLVDILKQVVMNGKQRDGAVTRSGSVCISRVYLVVTAVSVKISATWSVYAAVTDDFDGPVGRRASFKHIGADRLGGCFKRFRVEGRRRP